MSQTELPAQVKSFILEHVHSVEQLEILLHLRSRPDHEWTQDSVNAILRSSPDSVTNRLEDLVLRSLVARRQNDAGTVYVYAPSPPLREAVDALATSYATHRVAIIGLIYSRPIASLRQFADAFRLRKEDK